MVCQPSFGEPVTHTAFLVAFAKNLSSVRIYAFFLMDYSYLYLALREKRPNTEVFLVRILPYSV